MKQNMRFYSIDSIEFIDNRQHNIYYNLKFEVQLKRIKT
jgi:hypothetical protein